PVLRGVLVGKAAARHEHALGAALAGEVGQIIARAAAGAVELATAKGGAALAVEAAGQQVEHHDAVGGVEAGGRHHAAVSVDHGVAAVGGETLGDALDGAGGDAALLGVFFQRVLVGRLAQLG